MKHYHKGPTVAKFVDALLPKIAIQLHDVVLGGDTLPYAGKYLLSTSMSCQWNCPITSWHHPFNVSYCWLHMVIAIPFSQEVLMVVVCIMGASITHKSSLIRNGLIQTQNELCLNESKPSLPWTNISTNASLGFKQKTITSPNSNIGWNEKKKFKTSCTWYKSLYIWIIQNFKRAKSWTWQSSQDEYLVWTWAMHTNSS